MALINKLNNIGDAIRAKTGKEDKLTLEQMVIEIGSITGGADPVIEALVVTENGTYTPGEGVDGFSPVTVEVPSGGGELPEEAFVITGECNSRFAYNGWNWFIEDYGSDIKTKDITCIDDMFKDCDDLTTIPFDINMKTNYSTTAISVFSNCKKLETLSRIINLTPGNINNIFYGCYNLREIPDDFCDTWDWSYIESLTSAYSGNRGNTFYNCHSLRKFPMEFLAHANPKAGSTYVIYNNLFQYCYALDEILNLPIPHPSITSNMFSGTFNYCGRLKNMTFETNEDSTPKVVNWKSQTIDLSKYVGYCIWTGNGSGIPSEDLTEAQRKTISKDITNYNSGITVDKMVYNDATYQALKDDPDWYYVKTSSGDKEPYYSRYNHDSAVETINSLPDTSAYLATQTSGTNTIKFKGASGSKTDGGAINTLTEEEIAVATAKGWTVTLV